MSTREPVAAFPSRGENGEVRWRLKQEEPSLEELLGRLARGRAEERAVAAMLLAGFDDPRVEPALRAALEDPKRMVRRTARQSLERLGERRGREPEGVAIRHADPGDHARVAAVVDAWWGGRPLADALPRLFFVHFRETSFVAERDGRLAGFLCGFLSQTDPDEAYVHFAGVAPEERGRGLGRALYGRFLAEARRHGRSRVRCVTSPANEASRAFHRRLGFEEEEIVEDYDGRGQARVLLVRRI